VLEALHEFIEVNRTDIFAFIENSRRPISLQYDNNIFEKMLRFLVTGFPICHCDPPQPMHAEFDKVHYEIAIAILEVFWCGCLPQMKENRQAYPSGMTDTLRQVLIEAFDSGRRYAPIEEARRTGSPRG
jgi:hypothetical protein